jgi:hypothetical protein
MVGNELDQFGDLFFTEQRGGACPKLAGLDDPNRTRVRASCYTAMP